MNALDVLCAEPTRNLCAIAKFLFVFAIRNRLLMNACTKREEIDVI